jgi:acetolactate synthase-1/2/3 large subunit
MGCPDQLVINISGDGSFQMNLQELATIVQCRLPVKIIILNNGYLGMVRQWQELFHNKRYSQTELIPVPDFVKLAEAYGIEGRRVRSREDVRPVLKQAIEHAGPVLIDFEVAKDENVYPMVPPGGSLTKMMGG